MQVSPKSSIVSYSRSSVVNWSPGKIKLLVKSFFFNRPPVISHLVWGMRAAFGVSERSNGFLPQIGKFYAANSEEINVPSLLLHY